ncbi:MAG: PorT family protein [Muribaculaceae bacterium]|nr:PorT family protein [Muribaculaceae bacterium]
MKSIKRFVAVVIVCVAIALPASAQFSFGIKAGAKINEIPENIGAFEFDDCAGFTGGIMGEFTFPIVGLGVDASVMYSYEPISAEREYGKKETSYTGANHYLDIPINLKYKLLIPAVEEFVAPYVFTGPNFSFMLSKDTQSFDQYFTQNPVEVAWNLGIGLELFNHLQIGASYGWGLNKYITDYEILDGNVADANRYISNGNRKNCWTITAAYLF